MDTRLFDLAWTSSGWKRFRLELVRLLSSNATACILFHYLFDQMYLWEKQGRVSEDGSFSLTSSEINKALNYNRNQQDKAFKLLEEEELLFSTLRGMPAQRWFTVNRARVMDIILDNKKEGYGSPVRNLVGSPMGQLDGPPVSSIVGDPILDFKTSKEVYAHVGKRQGQGMNLKKDIPKEIPTGELFPREAQSLSGLDNIEEGIMKVILQIIKAGNFSNHKLPEEGEAPTKVIKSIIDALQDLKAGTFMSARAWDKSWIESKSLSRQPSAVGYETWAQVSSLVCKSATRASIARKEGVDGTVPKSLAEFMYNNMAKTSRFLYFLNRKAGSSARSVAKFQQSLVPKAIQKKLLHRYEVSVKGQNKVWTDGDFQHTWMTTKALLDWRKDMHSQLDSFNGDGSWQTHCATPERFMDRVFQWIQDDLGGWFIPRYLYPEEGDQWSRFSAWMKRSFGVEVDYKKEEAEKRLQRDERITLKIREKVIQKKMDDLVQAYIEHGEEIPEQEVLYNMAKEGLDERSK